MADLCSFSEFSFGAVEDKYSSSKNVSWNTQALKEVKDVQISGVEDWGDSGGIDYFCSNFGLFPDHDLSSEGYLLSSTHQKDQHDLSYLDYGLLDNLHFDMVSSRLQTCQVDEIPTMVELGEPTKQKHQFSFPLASLELLKNYGNGLKRLYGETERIVQPIIDDLTLTNAPERKLSTEDVMRIAGTRFIQSSSSSSAESAGFQYLISHPFDFSFSGLSNEEKKDVELAEALLASAEKVGYQQFERVGKLLNHCESMSANTGNSVQRLVYYFAEALRERIDRETGRVSSKVTDKEKPLFDPDKAMLSPSPTAIACHEDLPFSQVVEFTGVQAIMENVTEARKIHIIDLGIRRGTQWAILMQALESRRECPLELLKITAVGTTMKHLIEATGKRLMNFAQSMNIPFSFKIVTVSDMKHLKEDLFELDPEETIAVYSKFALRCMISQPDQLESVMRVIRNINPIVMVVSEVEANHNSTSFVDRFTETLFYFSAFFDCLETYMKRDDPNRMVLESLYFSHGIRNIVAAEGAERKIRNVKIDVWRAFFTRFGMVEEELSMSSLYQADLVAKRFACGSFCTFEMNGSCLLTGWKGTPLHSLSVWKFL